MIKLRVLTDYDPIDGNRVNNYLYGIQVSGQLNGRLDDATGYPPPRS